MAGSPKEAVSFLKESLKLNPKYDKAYYNLGVAHSDVRQFAEAAEAFKEATRLNDKDADYFFNLGMSYRQLNNLKEAEQALAHAVLLKPDDHEARYHLALVYLDQGNRAFATIHYLYLEKSSPEHAEKLKALLSNK